GGLVRGVQAGDGVAGGSGLVKLTVNGNLTQLAGAAGCGLTGGAGGPICAPNGSVDIQASGNITIGACITTFGAGTLSQSSNPSGIKLTAGNAIVSQGGL